MWLTILRSFVVMLHQSNPQVISPVCSTQEDAIMQEQGQDIIQQSNQIQVSNSSGTKVPQALMEVDG